MSVETLAQGMNEKKEGALFLPPTEGAMLVFLPPRMPIMNDRKPVRPFGIDNLIGSNKLLVCNSTVI
jgi:hypothetical protein